MLGLSSGWEAAAKTLERCVKDHPILRAVILDGNTEEPSFALSEALDLSRHIDVRDYGSDRPEHERIEQILSVVSDEQVPSVDEHPP
jgi:hypothetical protein